MSYNMRIRKPLFIIESKYDRAERERLERQYDRTAIFLVLAIAGGVALFSQCNSNSDDNPDPDHIYDIGRGD